MTLAASPARRYDCRNRTPCFLASRVSLKRCFSFKTIIERIKKGNLVLWEGDAGRFGTLAVARLAELEDDCSSLGCDCSQFDEALGGGDLAVFELKALQLKQAPELFN